MNSEAASAERAAIRQQQRRLWLAVGALAILGPVAGIPALVPLALVVGILTLAREAWLRRGLRGLEYRRELGRHRAVWGDKVDVTVTDWNRSLLPVAWVTADDALSEEVRIVPAGQDGTDEPARRRLSNGWTLLPFERVERRFRLLAERRSHVTFGPVHLETADLFAGSAAAGERTMRATLTIAPRSLPVREPPTKARARPMGRPRAGFPEDPALVAGVRAYAPGDPPRRIHWKATARTGAPCAKRYDASHARELLVAIDVQTAPGRAASAEYDPDLVEAICVVSASVVRHELAAGTRCGLAAAAWSYRPRPEIRIPPGSGDRQLLALMDALGRMSPWASAPFETLLGGVGRWLPGPTDLLIVTGRDARGYLPILRRLRRAGYPSRIVAVGELAHAASAPLRSAGVPVLSASLSPDWKTADALGLAP